jgi:hypothetical protein
MVKHPTSAAGLEPSSLVSPGARLEPHSAQEHGQHRTIAGSRCCSSARLSDQYHSHPTTPMLPDTEEIVKCDGRALRPHIGGVLKLAETLRSQDRLAKQSHDLLAVDVVAGPAAQLLADRISHALGDQHLR